MSSKSGDWQEDIDIDTDKDESADLRGWTTLNAVLTGLERKYKAQMTGLITTKKIPRRCMLSMTDRKNL